MINIIKNIKDAILNYYNMQQQKKQESLYEKVQDTEDEKHLTGTNNLLMRFDQDQRPKISPIRKPVNKPTK
jgi:hypothetical protein